MDRECADKHCDRDATTRNVGRRILSERESELGNSGVAVSRKMVGRVVGASENNRESVAWYCDSAYGAESRDFVGIHREASHVGRAAVGNRSVTETSGGRRITC